MKKIETKFSIQTDIKKSKDYWFLTLVCHNESGWKKNTSEEFKIKCPFEETVDMNIDNPVMFRSFCRDFGVPYWNVIQFIDKCIDIAVDEWEDITISNQSPKWLKNPEVIELLKTKPLSDINCER